MPETKAPGIRSVYKPDDKEYRLLKMVYERKLAMENSPDRKSAMDQWDRAEKQWEAYRTPKQSEDWQSNHYVPTTTSIVESALAEMVDQLTRPLILPRSNEDMAKATVMKHIVDYTWDISDGDTQLYNAMKDTLIFGTAIVQEYFKQEKRKVKRIKFEGDKQKEEEEEVFEYNDPSMEIVKLQDFFIDENARGFDGPYAARDCIRRYIMNIDDFKNFFSGEVWNHLDNAQYVKPGGDINYYEFFKPPMGIDQSKQVEVLWYWSRIPEDWLIITANDVAIKYGPNPHEHKQLPFARAVDVKRVHRFYGKGEAELLESIEDELNTLRRMVIDRNHLDIDKMFLISDTLGLDDEDLIARPHAMIPVSGDVNAAKAVEYGDIPASVKMSIEHLIEDAINVTGIDPRMFSAPSPRTATEAALIKESSLKKIRMKLRLLERELLVRVTRLRVANIIQFYSQPTLERIVGEKGTKEYEGQIAELQAQGLLVETGGGNYAKNYRQLRTEGVRLELDESGKPIEQQEKGVHFFLAKPEFFLPVARGGFDIKVAAGSNIPISKPLMQTKMTEMYDRLIELAVAGVGYDPVKLGDALLKINDQDPEQFKLKQEGGEEEIDTERQQMMIELANQENELMIEGNAIPPTGYVPGAHTRLHAEFMNSESFQGLPPRDERIKFFIDHVVGELAAQSWREMSPGRLPSTDNMGFQSFRGQGTESKPPQGGGQVNNTLKQIMPARIQGGADALTAFR